MYEKMDNMLIPFLGDPQRAFSIREAARLTGTSPTTATLHLSALSRRGILTKRRERNLVLFQANTAGTAFKDLAVYQAIRRIRSSGLLEYLDQELHAPEAVILFGSYATGEYGKGSDIDLFVLSPVKKQLALAPFEKRLGTTIQLFLHTKQEVRQLARENRELLNNVVNGVRLSGFFEVFP